MLTQPFDGLSDWIALPRDKAIHRRDLTPCPCGRTKFAVLESRRESSSGPFYVLGIACAVCVRPRLDQRLVGWLDASDPDHARLEAPG